ncbi:MAG: helix-turn-helix domain-containing protein [Lachnospiraceae bacterium]|nr:helix-turn-helix domain-containing protein [Lachnospiraceae bacterium]
MVKYKQKGDGVMFGKNLKYYRLKNNMSMKELADSVHISAMAISYYEKEERKPDMKTIKALADVLKIRVTDFLAYRDESLSFSHEEFRKSTKLNMKQQEYVRESVEEYFSRFYQIVRILGGEVLPKIKRIHAIEFSGSIDENALRLRKELGLSQEGPIGNISEILENRGILLYFCDIDNDDFSGMNGRVNDRPYIIVNKNMTAERIRSTMIHELAHFMFQWPDDMDEKEIEKAANAISGAFLFPTGDMERELGIRRRAITNDMIGICKEYGISMYMLVMRANKDGIINDNVARNFYIKANKAGWKKHEPSRIDEEKSTLFHQLVYRAVTEDEISLQKGAELLKKPYDEVNLICSAMEVE